MMKKKQAGQAFILVLIVLAIGALLVVPTLRLTDTILGSTQTITVRNRALYACEAAQQQVMWMLYHGNLIETMQQVGEDVAVPVDVNVCGVDVACTVTLRAKEINQGVMLATEHTIMPEKTVAPDFAPDKNYPGPFLYTITLTQESVDNSEGLDRIYDIISTGFASGIVYCGPTEFSEDGVNWFEFDDPYEEKVGNNQRLRWPNPVTYGYADFQPNDAWGANLSEFEPGEKKYLRFWIQKNFSADDIVISNWVMLKVGDVLTLSGPQAPIWVHDPYLEATFSDMGVFTVSVSAYPTVIPPRESTTVTYTITITNTDKARVNSVGSIQDYLPPGFTYDPDVNTTTTIMTTPDENQHPTVSDVYFPEYDITRELLTWDSVQLGTSGYAMQPDDTVTLILTATAEQGISGNYYNEVIITPKSYPEPKAFEISDPPLIGTYDQTYSWNTGVVIVPAYDSETEAEGVNIDTNLAIDPNGISIISWHVD